MRLITTDDAYAPARRRALKSVANCVLAACCIATGRFVSPAMRGESTFAVAQKIGPVFITLPRFALREVLTF
jgi:hypothetical protein